MAMVDISSALEKAKAIAAKLTKDASAQKRELDSEDGDRDSKRVRPGLGSSGGGLVWYGTGANSGVLFKQEEIVIPTSKVGLIIGKGGETLKRIELDTGTHISVPQGQPFSSNERIVTIEGDDKQREAAKNEIFGIIAGKIDTLYVPPGQKKVEYAVPRSRIGLVIGRGGEVIKAIQYRSGAKLEADRNPDATGDWSTIYIVGTDEMIESAKKLIEENVNPLASGETIRAIQSDCDVRVTIETQVTPQGRAISIQGMPDAVKYAKEMISEKVYGYATAYQTYESSGPVDPFAPGFKGYDDAYSGYTADAYNAYAYYYQQPYPQAGGEASASGATSSAEAPQTTDGQAAATPAMDVNDPNYAAYYAAMMNDPNYAAWYNYYYGNGAYAQTQEGEAGASTEQNTATESSSTDQKPEDSTSTDQQPAKTESKKPTESKQSKPSKSA